MKNLASQILLVSSIASLAACVPPAGGGGAAAAPNGQAAEVAGTYRAEVDGQAYELILAADGSGTINGTPGSWQLVQGQLILSDGQDTLVAGFSGRDIVVDAPEGRIVFVRQGGGGPGYSGPGMAPPAPARPFQPAKTLAGDVVAPAGSGAEFTVPDGWTHGPRREADGSEVYALTPADGGAAIVLSRRPLAGAQAGQRPSALLDQVMQQLLQGTPVTPVVATEDITVAGQPAARAIVRGQHNGQELELYVAGVVAEGYGFLMASMYPASSAETIRPAFDTVLSTFRGAAPPENTALRGRILGCWEKYQGNTDRSGSSSYSRKIGLNPDGTYWWRSHSYVSAEGAGSVSSDDGGQGRFRVEGNTVVTMSDKGEAGSYTVALQGGILLIDGDKYIPCGN